MAEHVTLNLTYEPDFSKRNNELERSGYTLAEAIQKKPSLGVRALTQVLNVYLIPAALAFLHQYWKDEIKTEVKTAVTAEVTLRLGQPVFPPHPKDIF